MLYSLLVIAYTLTIALGTLVHEAGHYLAAWLLNTAPKLHFASCDWTPGPGMEGGVEEIYFTLGGIISQNLISVGALAILFTRKTLSFTATHLLIVLGTFTFRSFYILGSYCLGLIRNVEFGTDETRLNELLSLQSGTVEIASALFSLIIALLLLKQVLKIGHPIGAYAVSMAIGIILGFLVWYKALGPWLLP